MADINFERLRASNDPLLLVFIDETDLLSADEDDDCIEFNDQFLSIVDEAPVLNLPDLNDAPEILRFPCDSFSCDIEFIPPELIVEFDLFAIEFWAENVPNLVSAGGSFK